MHDAAGQLIAAALQVSGSAFAQGVIAYVYNNLGELVDLMLPLGSPLTRVRYTHDDQGMITAISSPESAGADIAAYTYTMDGLVGDGDAGGRGVDAGRPVRVAGLGATGGDHFRRRPAKPDHGLHLQSRQHAVQPADPPMPSRRWPRRSPTHSSTTARGGW